MRVIGPGGGLDVFEQRSFQRKLAELDHFGADIVAQARVGLLEADDAAELEFDGLGRQHEGALAMDLLGEAALLELFDGLAHRATAGLIAVHQFGFGGQASASLQAFGGNAGQQIVVDLVVFAHGEGSVPRCSPGRNLTGQVGELSIRLSLFDDRSVGRFPVFRRLIINKNKTRLYELLI